MVLSGEFACLCPEHKANPLQQGKQTHPGHFLFTQLLKEGSITLHSTRQLKCDNWHWTGKTGNRVPVTHSHSPEELVYHTSHRATRDGTWQQSEPSRAVGGRLCSDKRMGDLSFLWEDVIHLFENRMGWQEGEAPCLRTRWGAAGLGDTGTGHVECPSHYACPQEQGTSWLSLGGPVRFKGVRAALKFRS